MSEQAKVGLIVIFSILFLVCVKVIVTDFPKEMEQRGDIKYSAKSIKTHIYIEDMSSPRIDVISNLQQMYDYSNRFYDENLRVELNKYTNEFFDNNSLIIVTIQEGSGSINNIVTDVKRVNTSTLDIIINRDVPQVGTADMAMSHLIIELNTSNLAKINNISINGK